jgi:hypothetical protein
VCAGQDPCAVGGCCRSRDNRCAGLDRGRVQTYRPSDHPTRRRLLHGTLDAGTAHNMIVATSGTPMVPLVRVASTSAWHAKVPLDLGAWRLLSDVRFAPESGRCRATLGCLLRIKSGRDALKFRCPLYPRKQTSPNTVAMSALGQKRTHALQQLIPSLRQVLPDFRQ